MKSMLWCSVKEMCGKKLFLLPGVKGQLASISTLCICNIIEIIFTEEVSKPVMNSEQPCAALHCYAHRQRLGRSSD